MTVSDVASIVVALATMGSLIYISRQVRVSRQQTKGQFLIALDEQFEKTILITLRLVNEPTFTPNGSDWVEVWKLMSIFERINIMVEDRILDVGLVDRLYGFRLLSLIANDSIYQRLESSGSEWQDFIDLCYAVAHYRQRAEADEGNATFVERVSRLSKQSHSLKNPFGF